MVRADSLHLTNMLRTNWTRSTSRGVRTMIRQNNGNGMRKQTRKTYRIKESGMQRFE